MSPATTDTSERGLERLICAALTGGPCDPGTVPVASAWQRPESYGVGWIGGRAEDYDREYCVDLAQLSAFLRATQPDAAEALALEEDGPARRKFLARLQGEISKRGTIAVLRDGIKHGPHDLDLFYGAPSPGKLDMREAAANLPDEAEPDDLALDDELPTEDDSDEVDATLDANAEAEEA